MLLNVVPLVGKILRWSIAVVLRHHMYVVDALQNATCKYVRCEMLYTADKRLAEVAEAENIASVLLGRQ
jgi:predicted nucleic acid-binding protein